MINDKYVDSNKKSFKNSSFCESFMSSIRAAEMQVDDLDQEFQDFSES